MREPPPPLRPVGALMLVLVHFAAYMSVVVVGSALAEGSTNIILFVRAAPILGALMALYIGLNRYTPELPTREALGLATPRGRQWALIGLGVVAGLALAPLSAEVSARVAVAFPMDIPEDIREEMVGAAARLPAATLALLVAADLAAGPFVEESLFRGFLQRRMSAAIGGGRAFAVAVGLYTVAQVNPRFMPAALLVGATTSTLALLGRGAWPAVAAHVAHQAAPYAALWAWRELPSYLDRRPAFVPPGVLVTCGLALAAVLAAAWGVTRSTGRYR